MLVSDILKAKGSTVVTAPPTLGVTDALAILNEKRIGSILIMESGAIVGILSERDVVRALAKSGPACLEGPVSAMMTRKVVTCSPQQSIAEVMQIMTEGRFRHVPVVAGGRLAGMVSIGDVVKWRLEETEEEVRQMTAYVAGS
ncbi:MAG TPA: CBS domain-containing protein [Kiloniellales bacterium]|nr:CBS domain-containing protein [Kiloniellales bacterium]